MRVQESEAKDGVAFERGSLLYQQLERVLRNSIESGRYPTLSRLPKEEELCESYNVSRVTVRKALSLLEEAGYLRRVRGKGTFVAERRIREQPVALPNVAMQLLNSNIVDLTPYNRDLFARSDLLVDLAPYLRKSDTLNRQDFYPELLREFSSGPKLIGLPIGFGAEVAYVNLDACRAAGIPPIDASWSMEEFEQVLRRFVRLDGNRRQVQWFSNCIPWPACVWSCGGEHLDSQRKSFLLDSPEAMEGLRLYHRIFQLTRLPPSADAGQWFLEGRLPVLFSTRVPDAFFEPVNFQWSTAPIPAGTVRATWIFMRGFGLLKTCVERESAWRHLESKVREELELGRSPRALHCPAVKSLAELADDGPVHTKINRQHIAALAYGHYAHTPIHAEPMNAILETITAIEQSPEWIGDDVVKAGIARGSALLEEKERSS